MDLVQRALVNLRRQYAILRSRSYRRLFQPEGDRTAVRDAEIVLADLRNFCRAEATCFSQDPHVTARNEGRREVYLRILHHLSLDEAEVHKLMEVENE